MLKYKESKFTISCQSCINHFCAKYLAYFRLFWGFQLLFLTKAIYLTQCVIHGQKVYDIRINFMFRTFYSDFVVALELFQQLYNNHHLLNICLKNLICNFSLIYIYFRCAFSSIQAALRLYGILQDITNSYEKVPTLAQPRSFQISLQSVVKQDGESRHFRVLYLSQHTSLIPMRQDESKSSLIDDRRREKKKYKDTHFLI